MGINDLKKVQLGYYPTPIEKMDNLAKALGTGDLYIKRDDMTGPAFGGNKTRKLEYLIRDAIDKGCTAVITYGGPQTNHGRTTVGAAVKYGLKPILILSGKDTGYLSGNLTLDAIMGADIYLVEDPKNIQDVTAKVVKKYEEQGDKVYIIPGGGSNPIGAAGYVMAVKEIMDQLKEKDLKIDHLVCTVGSMGTIGGLIAGIKYFKAPFDVVAVPVSPSPKGTQERKTVEFTNKLSEELGLGIEVTLDDVKIAYEPKKLPKLPRPPLPLLTPVT